MNILWTSFRRAANAGDMPLFCKMQPEIRALAQNMYGEKNVGAIRYGRISETAYILIDLVNEPDGAKGPASDEFYALSARFYEVLKDGLAGEAAVLAAYPPELARADRKGLGLVDLFEVQVNHPITGRLLVAPLDRQRAFRAS